MAVVVWVFSGGGKSEVSGLVPFLKKTCSDHTYERKSPIRRKPGPRPAAEPGYGRTGRSLARQLEKLLSESLRADATCDLILVVDDLDCHEPNTRRELFDSAIGKIDRAATIELFVGFASPEIEAWIVADWDNSIASDPDFRGCHSQMRHWLSTQKGVRFGQPETFSRLDKEKGSCLDKLSDAIVDSSVQFGARSRYAKGIHTARFLRQISPEVVSAKCSLFRELFNRLNLTDRIRKK